MRPDLPPDSTVQPTPRDAEVFASDALSAEWAERVARELSWYSELSTVTGQQVFFPRKSLPGLVESLPLEARAREELHVVLERLPRREVRVSLVIPAATLPLDFRNLRQKLYDPAGALEISALIDGLPDTFRHGLALADATTDSLRPLRALADPEHLRAWVAEAFERGGALILCWSVDLAETPTSATELLDAPSVEDALVALATVGELMAWSEQNAYVQPHTPAADEARRPAESKKSARGSSRDLAREAERELPRERGSRGRLTDEAPPPSEEAPAREPSSPSFRRVPLRSAATTRGRSAEVATSASPIDVDPSRAVAVGVKVQVAHGPFLGRVGVVQSLDAAKAQAKIVFGLLGATVALDDLVPVREGGKRPLLSSSHRRFPSSKS